MWSCYQFLSFSLDFFVYNGGCTSDDLEIITKILYDEAVPSRTSRWIISAFNGCNLKRYPVILEDAVAIIE